MESIHDRMQVILSREAASLWLDPGSNAAELKAVLMPYPSSEMDAYEISTLVNSPRNDSPEVIERVDTD